MTTLDLLRVAEIVSVGLIAVTTTYLLQARLLQAHYLLRLALALVCAGSPLGLYHSLQHDHLTTAERIYSVVENMGHAAVYLWLAMSRHLWDALDHLIRP